MSNTRKAEGEPMPQPQPQVGPAPVLQSVQVDEVTTGDGQKLVMLQILGPTGTYVSFINPDAAATIAAKLADTAMHAKTGLVIAHGLNGLPDPGKN